MGCYSLKLLFHTKGSHKKVGNHFMFFVFCSDRRHLYLFWIQIVCLHFCTHIFCPLFTTENNTAIKRATFFTVSFYDDFVSDKWCPSLKFVHFYSFWKEHFIAKLLSSAKCLPQYFDGRILFFWSTINIINSNFKF